jgi:hypothetical protein
MSVLSIINCNVHDDSDGTAALQITPQHIRIRKNPMMAGKRK